MIGAIEVSWWVVVLAAVGSFLFGWLWYSQILFGKAWMAAAGLMREVTDLSPKKSMVGSMIGGFCMQLVMAWILATVITALNVSGWGASLGLASWLWLGFVATIGLGVVLWEEKPLKLFFINNIHWLLALLIQTAIINAWR
jgi:uncharacterized membrane protein